MLVNGMIEYFPGVFFTRIEHGAAAFSGTNSTWIWADLPFCKFCWCFPETLRPGKQPLFFTHQALPLYWKHIREHGVIQSEFREHFHELAVFFLLYLTLLELLTIHTWELLLPFIKPGVGLSLTTGRCLIPFLLSGTTLDPVRSGLLWTGFVHGPVL